MERIVGVIAAIFETEEEMSAYLETRSDTSEIGRVAISETEDDGDGVETGEIVTADKLDYPCMALIFELKDSSFVRVCRDETDIEGAWLATSFAAKAVSSSEFKKIFEEEPSP